MLVFRLNVKQRAGLHLILPGDDSFQGGFNTVRFRLREEAYPAHVDAQQRRFPSEGILHATQQRSITAQRDDHVRLVHLGKGCHAQLLRELILCAHINLVRPEVGNHPCGIAKGILPFSVQDDTNPQHILTCSYISVCARFTSSRMTSGVQGSSSWVRTVIFARNSMLPSGPLMGE